MRTFDNFGGQRYATGDIVLSKGGDEMVCYQTNGVGPISAHDADEGNLEVVVRAIYAKPGTLVISLPDRDTLAKMIWRPNLAPTSLGTTNEMVDTVWNARVQANDPAAQLAFAAADALLALGVVVP